MKPLVSVIVPLYNAAPYIEEALESIVTSTYRPLEVVVVDDGSTDESLRVAQSFAKRHAEVRVLHQFNAGVSAARNHAIREAQGEWILPVDADDKISPTYIEHAVEQIADDVRVIGCRARYFGAKEGEWKLPEFSYELLARKNMIHISSLFRKADWSAVGGFCEEEIYREDWNFWLSVMELGGRYIRLDEIGLYYRVLAGSRRSKAKKQKRAIVDAINQRHAAYMERYLGGPLHYHRSWSKFLNRFRSVTQVGDFDRWTEGEVIDARRNLLRLTEGVVVKQFRTPNLLHGLWYGLIGKSKARRSYENAQRLGVLTPAPIAYREVRVCGILRESWYACKQSTCPYTFIDLIEHPDFPNRKQILYAIGRFTALLRQQGVWHRDYSAGNILFNADGSHIELIDLNRIRWRKHVPGDPFERLRRIEPEGIQQMDEGYASLSRHTK